MDTTETLTPKVKLLEQQQLLLDLDVREVCGDREDGGPLSVSEYVVRDHQGISWALHRGDPMGEVQTELAINERVDQDSWFLIRVWVPLLGKLTVFQTHSVDNDLDDQPFYRYSYKIAIGDGTADVKTFLCAATEIQRRFSDIVQTRITSQRRAGLRDIATLIRRVAEKKEAPASLQNELDDVHSYCGNTQNGDPAGAIPPISPSLEIITMTAAATTTATVTKDGDKFTCTLGATVLGTSKHQDYFEYHLKKGDVKVLREAGITAIDYVDGGIVTKTWLKDLAPVAAATPAADTTASTAAATPAANSTAAAEVATA